MTCMSAHLEARRPPSVRSVRSVVKHRTHQEARGQSEISGFSFIVEGARRALGDSPLVA